MRFNADHLQNSVPYNVNAARFKLKRMTWFTEKENAPHFENKGIAGYILNCTSPSAIVKATSTYNNNKKVRTNYQNAKTYHRWFLCADARNPPHTFAIVCHTSNQTQRFLKLAQESSFMGLPFYLVEPDLTTSRVGDYLPVVSINEKSQMLPLKLTSRILKRPALIQLPMNIDHTYYFILEHQQLTLSRMKSTTNSCTGYQCDRHWGKDGCVCATTTQGSPLVYQFDFVFDVDKRQFGCGVHVASINSFRTTGIFFQNIVRYAQATTGELEEKYLQKRRFQVRQIIAFINEHGGFKIIGWCKRGLLAIDGEAEKVENKDVNLRLSYVYPQSRLIFDNPDFKRLLIEQDFDTDPAVHPDLYPTHDTDESGDSDDDDSHSNDSEQSEQNEDDDDHLPQAEVIRNDDEHPINGDTTEDEADHNNIDDAAEPYNDEEHSTHDADSDTNEAVFNYEEFGIDQFG